MNTPDRLPEPQLGYDGSPRDDLNDDQRQTLQDAYSDTKKPAGVSIAAGVPLVTPNPPAPDPFTDSPGPKTMFSRGAKTQARKLTGFAKALGALKVGDTTIGDSLKKRAKQGLHIGKDLGKSAMKSASSTIRSLASHEDSGDDGSSIGSKVPREINTHVDSLWNESNSADGMTPEQLSESIIKKMSHTKDDETVTKSFFQGLIDSTDSKTHTKPEVIETPVLLAPTIPSSIGKKPSTKRDNGISSTAKAVAGSTSTPSHGTTDGNSSDVSASAPTPKARSCPPQKHPPDVKPYDGMLKMIAGVISKLTGQEFTDEILDECYSLGAGIDLNSNTLWQYRSGHSLAVKKTLGEGFVDDNGLEAYEAGNITKERRIQLGAVWLIAEAPLCLQGTAKRMRALLNLGALESEVEFGSKLFDETFEKYLSIGLRMFYDQMK